MQKQTDRYTAALLERERDSRLRKLRRARPLSSAELVLDGKQLINFASNDYLGLSQDPRLKARAIEYIEKWGVGSTASRLICGNLEPYEQIEQKLAKLKGTETALILATGFQANSTVIATIGQPGSVIASDKLNHNSISEGLLLSQSRWFRYQHNNIEDLKKRFAEKKLQEDSSNWIITESVFSMDGCVSNLAELKQYALSQAIKLYVDEAHATGVLGQNGMGLCAGNSLADIVMGTFGKGLGSFGAYIACSHKMRDFLLNYCPGIIYSTALPPPVLGAIDAALDLIPEMENERELLLNNAEYLRKELRAMGYDCGNSTTQIIPVIIGEDSHALSLSQKLETQGFFVPAIRPPTVPEGTARLRISLTAKHTKEQLLSLLKALKK